METKSTKDIQTALQMQLERLGFRREDENLYTNNSISYKIKIQTTSYHNRPTYDLIITESGKIREDVVKEYNKLRQALPKYLQFGISQSSINKNEFKLRANNDTHNLEEHGKYLLESLLN